MEKGVFRTAGPGRILITGPESTGKTDLAGFLAGHLHGALVGEYARGYIEKLDRPYTYGDVEHIARHQEREYLSAEKEKRWVIFDTWLIITRVWFLMKYGRKPSWIDARIRQARFDLVLLCDTDIPWIPDPVRENGGDMRQVLFRMYRQELEDFQMNWKIVSGSGEERFRNAWKLIQTHVP